MVRAADSHSASSGFPPASKRPAARSIPSSSLGWPPSGLPASPFHARLSNLSRKKFLDVLLEPASTLYARMRGLMFRKKPAALLFTFDWTDRHSIHSFFVAYPFDAIYLDEHGLVADVFHSVPPFSPLLTPRSGARYLLELPDGGAARLNARIGDPISICMRP